ncbi:helix-turn-helix domain-containing protein [Halalkalibacter sp. APA_J-10(15)]|uniref:helix-turn-helix domain-containing protein n=1 Tax=Halalkalibacter sp. APA_J-10(15) TaxID=2933805 RepID=UPI001FF53162|nr:helix-turn-helix transcriptional regulator [Halalkalibacter sp. APA_J-10(15)]MCK0473785.1 helix-turn-helix domain-containing protein [Halalkalibacter sp. APA_J-10(15)]
MDKKEFGKRLRHLRKTQTSYTVKEFGSTFNLAESTISGYENGARMPDASMINKFADFFEVDTDYLLCRSNQPRSKINIAYDGGVVDVEDEEERDYLMRQREEFRKLKKRMQQRMHES